MTYFLSVGLAVWAFHTVASAVTFTVSPVAVSSTYTGLVTLNIGGLTNGEQVSIQKYADVNGNGVLNNGEPLIDAFKITDGGVSLIGGVTNINVAFDQNSATGAITTSLSIAPPQPLQNMVGSYIYRLVSPSQNFSPTNVTFVVTNAVLSQSVRGTVYSNGVTPLAGAAVIVLASSTNGNGGAYVGGAITDGTGRYQLNLKPGSYSLIPTATGYFTDQSLVPPVVLTAGVSVTNNLFMTNGPTTISGSIIDSGNSSGIAGVLVLLSGGNLFSSAFSDTNGNYTAVVTPTSWKVRAESTQTARRNYLIPQVDRLVDTSTGSVANVSIGLTKGNAMFYGTFTNTLGVPISGVSVRGGDYAGQYESSGWTDANGNYCVTVLGGTNVWYCHPDDSDPVLASYIVTGSPGTNLNIGQALLLNFTALSASNHITGVVKDAGNHPVTNLNVNANATINGTSYNSDAKTDQNGFYSMVVAPGTWNVSLDCGYVGSLGFNCPSYQVTNIVNADAVVNFILSTLQITTTALPDGTNGVYYSQALAASGGQPPYTWSISPGGGSLPPDLSLGTNGVISGIPTTYGFSSFSVRVSDNQGASADGEVSLNLQPAPLQILTTNLPSGTNGQFYFQQLSVTGGQPPYSWYFPVGATGIPPGLNLSTNGVLSGMPGTNGQFNFPVAVFVNNPYQATTQLVALTIARAPLQVTTTSPLPNATRDVFYSVQLLASGGLPPYTWLLSPASAPLPMGLNISTNGVLSGTPTVTGGFGFYVRVTDAAQGTNDWLLSLTVNPPITPPPSVTLTGAKRVGNGGFQFSFNTLAGTNYTIQYTPGLAGSWTSVLTIVGSGNGTTVIDPNASGNQRFYRIKIGP